MGTLVKIQGLSISESEATVLLYLNDRGERQGCDIVRDVGIKIGSVYVVLQRMEAKKFLSSRKGEEHPSKTSSAGLSRQDIAFSGYGPLPRFWELTERGRQVCKAIIIIKQLSSAPG